MTPALLETEERCEGAAGTQAPAAEAPCDSHGGLGDGQEEQQLSHQQSPNALPDTSEALGQQSNVHLEVLRAQGSPSHVGRTMRCISRLSLSQI